jgi:hypothetical protein
MATSSQDSGIGRRDPHDDPGALRADPHLDRGISTLGFLVAFTIERA